MQETAKNRLKNSHYSISDDGKLIPKKCYESEKDALAAAQYFNSKETTKHKLKPYRCDYCGKWHLGGSGQELTDDDRKQFSEILKNKKKFNTMVKSFFNKRKNKHQK